MAHGRRLRVLRVIARLNMGGPAHHVSLLSGLLDRERYENLLLSGTVGPGEASLAEVAERHGAAVETVPGLGPELSARDDLRALARLVRAVRRFRPDIVHTHTAKAGLLGRLAALSVRPRPLVVHTYHGHVLEGYFGPFKSRLYRTLEHGLGTVSDRLVGVSAATVDDLVRLRVAPRDKFRVIPIGLDLEPFLELNHDRGRRLDAPIPAADGDVVLIFCGRLVPIKSVDLLLRGVARAREMGAQVRLAVVGDGELRPSLEQLAAGLGIADAVHFLGYRSDVAGVLAASDLAVLSSRNEGTPVSLIEAAAAGLPAVATAVGGVPEVVADGTGVLVSFGDEEALGRAIAGLAADPPLRRAMGERARAEVAERFSVSRLLRDVDALYVELLAGRDAA